MKSLKTFSFLESLSLIHIFLITHIMYFMILFQFFVYSGVLTEVVNSKSEILTEDYKVALCF